MIASSSENLNLSPAPERLHDRSRVFGLLQTLRNEDGCQIARIDGRDVVLPLEPHLSGFIGSKIGLMMDGEELHVRRLA